MHSSRRQGKKRKKEMQCVAAHNSSFILRPACAEVFFFHIHGNNGEAILVSILQQQQTEEAIPALALLLTVAATVRYLTKLSPTEVEIFFPHIHVSLGFTVHTRESECGQTGGEKKQERKKKPRVCSVRPDGGSDGSTQTLRRKPSSLLSAVDCGSIVDSSDARTNTPLFLSHAVRDVATSKKTRQRKATVGGQDTRINNTYGKVIKEEDPVET